MGVDHMFKGNGCPFKGDISFQISVSPFLKMVCSKRKEFAPFPFRIDYFSEGLGLQKSKQKHTKVVYLVKYLENQPRVSDPLKKACN